ncbi:hypothetical protein JAAARDRAFT_33967 [Jaapia argillacea MUCL 33604]|uniref:Uncharacterized protein n=1 Tax=Jaapia argillacea MUCL 33604 TaxID=933084 RepID=A0A067PZD2_9AGAM|nr:hypothetical protein JAAARDRAFT_33967 [Jaapia argillacea MUCL 33604]
MQVLNDDSNVGDSDSLFGSPPPSPSRPRSPPGLALPGASLSFAENVGTIALPGSLTYSELSVIPPVSRLGGDIHHHQYTPHHHASDGLMHLPPQFHAIQSMTPPPHLSSVGSRSSSSTPVPSTTTKPRKKSTAGKSRSATPRPPPPPIQMPDPDAPPPVNFLRNQQALLGLAGLVGGVNPANLNRHAAGSSAKHPIVVDDGPTLAPDRLLSIDPTHLPTPSGQAIVDSLIKQKNIFPVLSSLLKLISPPSTQSFSSNRTDAPPPAKRKKLNNVPAGAADWDVPFPFHEGEGPEAYRARWERERAKQLITQLIGLIQNAAQKAATKEYLQKQKEHEHRQSQNVWGYYRPITATYGQVVRKPQPTPAQTEPSTLTDVTNESHLVRHPGSPSSSEHTHHPISPSITDQQLSLDQLIASLLPSGLSQDDPSLVQQGLGNPAAEHGLPQQELTTDIESWMSILETFPSMEIDNDSKGEDFSMSLDGLDFPPSTSTPTTANTPSTSGLPPANSNPSQRNSQPLPDFMIDPVLLALSVSHPSTLLVPRDESEHTDAASVGTGMLSTPSLTASPMPSSSSLADPLTPSNWDAVFTDVDIFAGDQVEDPVDAASVLLQLASTSPSQMASCSTFTAQGIVSPSETLITQANQVPHLPPPAPTTRSLAFPTPLDPPTTVSAANLLRPARSIAGPGRASVAKSTTNKDDVLRRAKERRRQLVAEIERAKVQLWESTLEQGVLTHLAKDNV